MQILNSIENVYLLLGLIVPGKIFIFARAKYLTGKSPPDSESILSYITISFVYLAVALPFISLLSVSDFQMNFVWLIVLCFFPLLLGAIFGFLSRREWDLNVGNILGMQPLHFIPTAWDWKFSAMSGEFVLVMLKNDTKIAGYCGANSFISSDPKEREIYIEKLYDFDDHGNWIDCASKGILIMHSEIKTIQFLPLQP